MQYRLVSQGGNALSQRFNVPTAIPTSRATTSTAQLSGGSSRATALSLNICPYRAICVFHRHPQVLASIGATTILTQGARSAVRGTAARPLERQVCAQHGRELMG